MSKYDKALDAIVADNKKARKLQKKKQANKRANNVIKKAKGQKPKSKPGPKNAKNGPRRNSQPKVITKTVVVRSKPSPRREPVKTGPIKVHVSNLDLAVTKLDMQELFQEFGKLGKINMHFNENGKSQGSCDVTFTRRQDGLRAVKKYDGVPLDGRAMKIKPIGEEVSAAPAKSQSLKNRLGRKPVVQTRAPPRGGRVARGKPNQPRNNARNNRPGKARQGAPVKKGPVRNAGGRGRPGKGPRNSRPEKKITEEDLDKQLDAYLVKGAL